MPENREFKTGINENWKVVVLAVAGAATFWLFNALNKSYDTRLNYPIVFEFNRDSVVVVTPLAEEINIDVNGGGWNLIRNTFWVNSTPIKIELDNPTTTKHYTQASLVPIISDQLSGLKLNYVITDTVFINIEEKVVRKAKILVDSIQIPLEESHRIVSPITLSFDSITLSGPKSMMTDSKRYVWVEFDQDEIDGDFNREVPIKIPGDGLIASSAGKVGIQFEVDRFVRHALAVKLELLNFPKDSTEFLQDTTVNLNFTINESRLNEITGTDFGISADYYMKDMADSTITPVLTYYPDGVYDVELMPQKLKLQVK